MAEHEALGVLAPLALERRVAIDLQLVKLYEVDAEGIYVVNAVDDIGCCLVRKAEDKVRSNIYSRSLGLCYGVDGSGEVMTAVYVAECGVVDRLDAILHSDIFRLRNIF